MSFMAFDHLDESGLSYTVDVVFTLNGVEVGSYSMVDASEEESAMKILELEVTGLEPGEAD